MIVAKCFLMRNTDFQASSVHAWHTVSTFQGRRGVLIPNTKVFLPTIVLSRDPWSCYPCYAITHSRPRRKRRKMRMKMRRRRSKLKFSRKVNFVQNENPQTPIWSLRHVNRLKYLMKYDKDNWCSPVIQVPLGCVAVLETSFEYNQVSTSSTGFQYNETSLKLSGMAHRNISTIRWPLKRKCVPDIYQEIYWQQRDAHVYPKKGIIPTGQWGWR